MTAHRFRAAAELVSEALPFMRRYAGSAIVVKFGGAAMGTPELTRLFARDVALLKQIGVHPIVVHGGGPQIGRMLERLAIPTEFRDGLRVTDRATVEVVEMVLCGSINKQLAADITREGVKAVGLSGKDGGLIRVRQRDPALGFVGEPERVASDLIWDVVNAGMVPVIAPVGMDADGQTYNINADTAAGAIAGAVRARRLLMLADVPGVLDRTGDLVPALGLDDIPGLIADGTIAGGMIPKVRTCVDAVQAGVNASVILDGREPHAILVEMFTQGGVGTLIRRELGDALGNAPGLTKAAAASPDTGA